MSDLAVRDAADGLGMGEAPPRRPEGPSVVRDVRRVVMADLVLIWPWLAPRLLERYPGVTERGIRAYLMQIMADNEAIFFCTDHSALLATVTRVPLEGNRIDIQFCLSAHGKDDTDPAEPLYDEVVRWGKLLHINKVCYGRFDDPDAFVARRRLGRGHTEQVRMAFLEPLPEPPE
jgi:hypothetical protein